MLNKNDSFNNELEKVLEKKMYNENAKSMLLNILYKIELAYKDYETVKQNVETREEFITRLINNIQNNVEYLKLISPNSQDAEILGKHTFLIEKDKKRILCYNMERKVLYSISKISKKKRIVKEKYTIIDKTLSDLLNVGDNINTLEPLRDFNGYSWTIIPDEIESIDHNLIYQNLIMLVGIHSMNKWIDSKEYIIDYFEMFKNKMEELYGIEKVEKIVENICTLSFLLDVKYDKKVKEKMTKLKEITEKEIEKTKNKEIFVETITEEKKKITKEIKEIDETLNNKRYLEKEYQQRNEKLPIEEKIFSLRILSEMMEKERAEKIDKIEELNEILKPKNYIKYKTELEEKEKYLELLSLRDIDNKINREKINLQRFFLDCYKIKLKRVETKQQMLKLIYEFRYYCLIQYNRNNKIYQVQEIQEEIKMMIMRILEKAHELKVIQKFSKRPEVDYELLKNIFISKSIKLEKVSIKLTKAKEKNKFFIETYDEETLEEKQQMENIEDLKNKDFEIRYNKKVKAFY